MFFRLQGKGNECNSRDTRVLIRAGFLLLDCCLSYFQWKMSIPIENTEGLKTGNTLPCCFCMTKIEKKKKGLFSLKKNPKPPQKQQPERTNNKQTKTTATTKTQHIFLQRYFKRNKRGLRWSYVVLSQSGYPGCSQKPSLDPWEETMAKHSQVEFSWKNYFPHLGISTALCGGFVLSLEFHPAHRRLW